MNTNRPLLAITIAFTGTALAQGPLLPSVGTDVAVGPVNALTPGGAPQATMKTLHQVEPRVPISSLPFTISQSGSYYLTGNLTFSDSFGHAITIQAANVTLDLNGFAISSTAAVTGFGVAVLGSPCTIRNGTILGTTAITPNGNGVWTVTTPGGFNTGIYARGETGCAVSNLTVKGCNGPGINASDGLSIDRCLLMSNKGGGIDCGGGQISHSSFLFNLTAGGISATDPGTIIDGCTANNNSPHGILAPYAVVTRCQAAFNGAVAPVTGYGIRADEGMISDCVALTTFGIGISAEQGVIRGCVSRGGSSHGIIASKGSISHSSSFYNAGSGIHCEKGTIFQCSAYSNSGDGFTSDYGSVTACAATDNFDIGINAFGGTVSQSRATGNEDHGIYATSGTITSCSASGNNTYNEPVFTNIYPNSPVATRTANFPTP